MIERAVCANANDVKGKRTPIVEHVNVCTIHLEHGEVVASPIALEYQRLVQVLAAKATCYHAVWVNQSDRWTAAWNLDC